MMRYTFSKRTAIVDEGRRRHGAHVAEIPALRMRYMKETEWVEGCSRREGFERVW
jgi:hypothetical protein